MNVDADERHRSCVLLGDCVEAGRFLFTGHAPARPEVQLNSAATVAEAEQNQICAQLSVALLAGLLLNALAGWWWADPGAALVIAAVAAREGRES